MNRTLPSLFLFAALAPGLAAGAQSQPTVLVDVDHRATVSLDGDWHFIVDPYFGGLYSFHREIKANGYFMDADPNAATGQPIEYDFSKAPTLKVP